MASCKRILIIGPAKAGKLSFLKALTGSLPNAIPSGSHGGLTHQMVIENKYYKATVDIWLDEFDNPELFAATYTSAEAEEVCSLFGAIILCLPDDTNATKAIEQVRRVADKCSESTLLLTVLRTAPLSRDSQLALEDLCVENGFELVLMDAKGKNDFGELQGIERAQEAIEAADWSELLDETDENNIEKMLMEDSELNQALLSNDVANNRLNVDEASVEELEALMQRILIAREHSSDLSPEEKKRMAAKLVAEVMHSST